MKLVLITHNKNKMKEFSSVLEPEFEIEIKDMEYPELRSDEVEDIVSLASKQLADTLNETVLVEDSGFFINALSGFPGTCTAYVFKRIGNEGLLKLMEKEKDRRIYYKSAIGFCQSGSEPVVFTGIERGKMANEEIGNNGWGQDPIFVPEGKRKTYGETRKEGDVNPFRLKSLEKLKAYLIDLDNKDR